MRIGNTLRSKTYYLDCTVIKKVSNMVPTLGMKIIPKRELHKYFD